MPAWGQFEGGLRDDEIARLVAFIRELGSVQFEGDFKPHYWIEGNPAEGQRLYAEACSLCHGPRGEGKEGPALANAVFLELATDTYLFKTIQNGRRGTSMAAFGAGSAAQRALTDAEIASIVAFIRTWGVKK
jgi:mono/diheme cytochrome c family protein